MNALSAAALFMVTFLAFVPVLSNGFLQWDDTVYLTRNTFAMNLTWQTLREIFSSRVEQIYVPLTTLSFALEYKFFKLQPFIYHLNNLIFHCLNVVWVFWLGRKLSLTLRASFLAALVFGIHPMHVESVAWISERKDVLYSFFYLLSLLAYVDYVEKKDPRKYMLSILFGVLSLLAKPMALSLPLVLFLIDYFLSRKTEWKVLCLEKLPHLTTAVGIAWITFAMNAKGTVIDWTQAPFLFIWSIMFYPVKFFFPVEYLPLYAVPKPIALSNPVYFASMTGFLMTAYFTFVLRENKIWMFALLYYVLSIFFLWRFESREDLIMVADHYMYLPSLGFCVLLGFAADTALQWVKEHKASFFPWSVALLCAGVLFLGAFTFRQSRLWGDEPALWQKVIKRYPHWCAYDNLGLYYAHKGRYDLAIENHSKALSLGPLDKPRVLNNRGLAYRHLAKFDQALDDYNQAIALLPDYALALMNRGLLLDYLGRYDEALNDYSKSLELYPYNPQLLRSRAIVYHLKKQNALALKDLNKAIALQPDYDSPYFLRGQIYALDRNWEMAVKDFDTVLKLNPKHPRAQAKRDEAYAAMGH